MHIPPDYAVKDHSVITAFMQHHPFAQLVCATETFPVINHVPLLYDDERNCLWGHLAKNNPDLTYLNNSPVSVVFTGPHGYISPDWYEKPGVPTWNYQALHVGGTCHTETSESIIKKVVDKLSNHHQTLMGFSWDGNYKPSMLSAIVAIRIEIRSIQCQFKLSQDRSTNDQQNIINALKKNGQIQLAKTMNKILNH